MLAPIAWMFALEDYQKSRIVTFLDPEQDARGAGYQQIQARITVGSGGVTGKGFMQGTQGQLRFLPVAHNDFIFSVLAEEQGFAGVVVALALYLFVIMRSLDAARLSKDRVGAYLVLGVLSCFTFQVVYNITMSAGLAPVKGLTLPLMSYGGSSMIATLAGFGLILSVRMRRFTELSRIGMTKEMIIATNGHETRVAILEDDLLAEVFVERERNRGVVGNVYKGRVSKVLPGMQSAFVDLGLERDGFLYVSDVVNTMEEFERLSGDDDDDEAPAPAAPAVGSGAAEVAAEPRRRPTAPSAAAAAGAAAIAATATRAPSPRSRSWSRKGRTSSCRWPRSRSAPRARASPRTSRCPAASWSSCPPSTTSACRARSRPARNATACAASSRSSATSTSSAAA